MAIALIWMTAGMLLIPLATANFGVAIGVIAFYLVAAFAITTPQQHRLIATRPDATPVVVALNQSVLYLAIVMSGVVGAAGIELVGAPRVSVVAGGLALGALSCPKWPAA